MDKDALDELHINLLDFKNEYLDLDIEEYNTITDAAKIVMRRIIKQK